MTRHETEYVQVALMPKQIDFVKSEALHSLYSGAVRAGKTRALCYKAVYRAQHKKAKVGLTRKTLVTLKNTTMRTLLEPDGDLPPVLPEGTYHYSKAQGQERIRLHEGGEILPFGCDDPVKIGSLTLSDICIDEGIEIDIDEWSMLVTRCSLNFQLPNGTYNKRTISIATNPGHPGHWMYKLFYESDKPAHICEVSNTSSLENWHLPIDFTRDRLDMLSGPQRDRLVHGMWVAFEGAIYDMFDPDVHCKHDAGPWDEFITGVDWGYSHPCAIRVIGIRQGHAHVVAEHIESGNTQDVIVEACQDAYNQFSGPSGIEHRFACDPSRPDLIAALRKHGLDAYKADNDVMAGITHVQNMLSSERFTMEPHLKGNAEYHSYRWDVNKIKEQPIKKGDDSVDADRYALMTFALDTRSAGFFVLGGGDGQSMYKSNKKMPEMERRMSDERMWMS